MRCIFTYVYSDTHNTTVAIARTTHLCPQHMTDRKSLELSETDGEKLDKRVKNPLSVRLKLTNLSQDMKPGLVRWESRALLLGHSDIPHSYKLVYRSIIGSLIMD